MKTVVALTLCVLVLNACSNPQFHSDVAEGQDKDLTGVLEEGNRVERPDPALLIDDAEEMENVQLVMPESQEAEFRLEPSSTESGIYIDERGRRWRYLYDIGGISEAATVNPEVLTAADGIDKDGFGAAPTLETLANALRPYMAAQGKMFILAEPDYDLARKAIAAGDAQLLVPGSDYLEQDFGLLPQELSANSNLQALTGTIGSDGREHITDLTSSPFRAQVYIDSKNHLVGSGAMIGSRTILTAAHVVSVAGHNSELTPSLEFSPGAKRGSYPYGTHRFDDDDVCAIYWPTSFHNSSNHTTPVAAKPYDFAVVRLCSNPGVNYYFGFGNLTAFWKTLYLWGYPAESIPQWLAAIFPQVYGMECEGREMYAGVYHHKCDASGGQSGTGIYRYTDAYGRIINGVHTGPESTIRNRAVHLRNSTVYFILEYGF